MLKSLPKEDLLPLFPLFRHHSCTQDDYALQHTDMQLITGMPISAYNSCRQGADTQLLMQRTQAKVYDMQGSVIPRMRTLRRVPKQYWQILPLGVMKRHQCIVVGGTHRMLTVAIVDQENTALCEVLSQLTGCSIFPVLVDATYMRLLLRRLERGEQSKYRVLRKNFPCLPYHSLQIHSMLMVLTALRK